MEAGLRNIVRSALDQQVGALSSARDSLRKPSKGWLLAVRQALGVKQQEIAKQLGITRQSYAQFETAEVSRSITLKSLERAAEAMDCDFVYFLVPKQSIARSFGELAQSHDPAFRQLRKTEHSMALEGQAIGDLTKPAGP
jgi:predicted DNA-binding mobile mystery protein A